MSNDEGLPKYICAYRVSSVAWYKRGGEIGEGVPQYREKVVMVVVGIFAAFSALAFSFLARACTEDGSFSSITIVLSSKSG